MTLAEPSNSQRATGAAASPAVCAIVRAEIRPGLDDAFEALLRDHAFTVTAEEQGCRSYVVTRMLGSRSHFAVHAHFSDMKAFERHGETRHLKRLLPRINALLVSPVSVELFFAV